MNKKMNCLDELNNNEIRSVYPGEGGAEYIDICDLILNSTDDIPARELML